jgi:translation elongation factor EF-4
MTLETIADKLLRLGIVDNTRAANTTTLYAMQWMSGQKFDLSKSQVQTHRARLRKIGIDISDTCDVSRHSPVHIRKAVEVTVRELPIPIWYQRPQVQPLRAVA